MKKFFLIVLLFIGCSGGGSDDPSDYITETNCEDIQGIYIGSFIDNCPGQVIRGDIEIELQGDCTYAGSSSHGVQQAGTFHEVKDWELLDQISLEGEGTTTANGCGHFDISCIEKNGGIDCNYTYLNGKSGFIEVYKY